MQLKQTERCGRGSNQSGILGNGNTTDLNIPTQMGTGNNWAHVDGHFTYNCN